MSWSKTHATTAYAAATRNICRRLNSAKNSPMPPNPRERAKISSVRSADKAHRKPLGCVNDVDLARYRGSLLAREIVGAHGTAQIRPTPHPPDADEAGIAHERLEPLGLAQA